MTEEAKASGISPELTETDKLLEQIIEMFEESDREGGENLQQVEQNKENERKKAEEMRNQSMEKLGETLKRKAADNGQVTPKKRGSGTETLIYLREKAEKQFELRKEELEVKKKEQSNKCRCFKLCNSTCSNNNNSKCKYTFSSSSSCKIKCCWHLLRKLLNKSHAVFRKFGYATGR